MNRLAAGEGLPPADRRLDVFRIQLHGVGAPPRLLGGDDRGATAHEGIEDDAAALGAIQDRIGHEHHWFHSGMHGKLCEPVGPQGVHARIGPDVAAMPAVLAKLEVVHVWRRS